MSTTLNGRVFDLARWFDIPIDANSEDHPAREEILGAVWQATAVGVAGGRVIVKTPLGACIMERAEIQGCPVVMFDHVCDDRWTRTRFWMNASSVKELGERLRQLPRAPFDALFVGAVPPPCSACLRTSGHQEWCWEPGPAR